jgi:hypothetical protein
VCGGTCWRHRRVRLAGVCRHPAGAAGRAAVAHGARGHSVRRAGSPATEPPAARARRRGRAQPRQQRARRPGSGCCALRTAALRARPRRALHLPGAATSHLSPLLRRTAAPPLCTALACPLSPLRSQRAAARRSVSLTPPALSALSLPLHAPHASACHTHHLRSQLSPRRCTALMMRSICAGERATRLRARRHAGAPPL